MYLHLASIIIYFTQISTATPQLLSEEHKTSNNSNNNKWVVNLSKTPLTPAQIALLAKSLIFVATPQTLPNVDYISAIESISYKLMEQDAKELKVDVSSLHKRVPVLRVNLTKEERRALAEGRDPDRMVLTADKGLALVVLDKEDKQKSR